MHRVLWLSSAWIPWISLVLLGLRHPSSSSSHGHLLATHCRLLCLSTDAWIWRRTVMHKHAVGWWLVGKRLGLWVPSVVTLGTGSVGGRWSRVQISIWWHVRRWCIKLVVATSHLHRPKHRLCEIDGASLLKDHFETYTTGESPVFLGLNKSLDKVGTKHGLLHINLSMGLFSR